MAKIEVDEEEFLVSKRMREALSKIAADPKARLKLQEAHKLADPNAKTPELDALAPVNEELTAMKQRIEDFEKKAAEEKAEAEQKAKLDKLQGTMDKAIARLESEGYTAKGIESIKKIMEDNATFNVDMAIAYHEKLHPPETPIVPSGSGAWNFMDMPKEGDDDLKRLIETKGESMPLLDKMVRDTLTDVRAPTRR